MRHYNSTDHIRSVEDAKHFFNHIVNDLDINFHPDDSFHDYVYYNTNKPCLTSDECDIYDSLMDECFKVCSENDADIYETTLPILKERIGMKL